MAWRLQFRINKLSIQNSTEWVRLKQDKLTDKKWTV